MKRSTPAKPASAVRRASSGVGRPAPTIAVAPLPDADHDAREAAVLDEHVRAEPEGHPREPAVLRQLERLGDVLAIGGHDEIARRSADPVRGVAGQGLVLEHAPAELDLRRGRRGGGRRLGGSLARFARRLRRCLRYARTASFAAPGGRFSTVVLSCHSWRLLTLPVRLRRAIIASQAALAADIVVVYGTRCISAARRIA